MACPPRRPRLNSLTDEALPFPRGAGSPPPGNPAPGADHAPRNPRRRLEDDLGLDLDDAGLRVERATYAYSFLAPAAAALACVDRIRSGRRPATESDVERRALDRVFAPLAAVERRLLTHVDIPVGTSVVALATR